MTFRYEPNFILSKYHLIEKNFWIAIGVYRKFLAGQYLLKNGGGEKINIKFSYIVD